MSSLSTLSCSRISRECYAQFHFSHRCLCGYTPFSDDSKMQMYNKILNHKVGDIAKPIRIIVIHFHVIGVITSLFLLMIISTFLLQGIKFDECFHRKRWRTPMMLMCRLRRRTFSRTCCATWDCDTISPASSSIRSSVASTGSHSTHV